MSGIVQVIQAPKNLSFKQKLEILLKPTAEWDPSGRPCWTPAVKGSRNSRTSITKTRVLINGVPIDGISSDDAMQLCECPSASRLSQNSNGGTTSEEVIFFPIHRSVNSNEENFNFSVYFIMFKILNYKLRINPWVNPCTSCSK